MQHVVIRRAEFVAGTWEHPEVGVFAQTHGSRPPVPWGKLNVGDIVWMKWSAGPIVAQAIVQGFRQIENCTSEELRNTTSGFQLYKLDDYWKQLPPVFFGMTIYLQDEKWLDNIFEPQARSYGESWIILDTSAKTNNWLTKRNPAPSISDLNTSGKRSRTISASVRFEVFRRDNFTCQYCGRSAPEVKLQVDHVIPFSTGGSNNISNLRTACQECNIGKGSRQI